MSVSVKEKPSRCFFQIKYEAFATDPCISEGFALFYFLSAALLSTLVLFSFFSRVLYFTLSHFSLASLPRFLSVFLHPSLLLLCHMGILLLCVFLFFSHQFCCFTSVKSGADVHIIPYSALVISCVLLPVSQGADTGFDSTGLLMISNS